MGIITVSALSISLILFFFKYKKNNQTRSANVLQNPIPLGEIDTSAYDEIGNMEELSPMDGTGGENRRNEELRRNQGVYQNVPVCNDRSDASNSDQSIETESNYEEIARSQVVEKDNPYQQLDVHAGGGTGGHIPAFSKKKGGFKYENIFLRNNYENVDSNKQIKDVNVAALGNDDTTVSDDNIDTDNQ